MLPCVQAFRNIARRNIETLLRIRDDEDVDHGRVRA